MKIYRIIRTAVFLGLTVAVLVCVHPFVENLRYFIGALMIFYGVEETVFTYFHEKKHYSIRTLYWNAVEIILGITLIALLKEEGAALVAVVCAAWATWSILRETRELVEATEEIKEKITAIPNILESLVVIGFSISMIIEPTKHHAEIHMYLLAVELSTKVLFPWVDILFEHFKHKKGGGHIEEQASEPEAAAAEEE